ncbi:MAG TPA: folate-binding protein [Kiloniellales bacterium]|nr:folate-binding protein [Kiloniellales bacterium]
MAFVTPLDDRAVLRIAGPDRVAFLQGLVSNDVEKLTPMRALWAAFLTPQGKYLHDFFLVAEGEAILLEGEAARLADLEKRLKVYKLRSKVDLGEAIGRRVYALWGEGALAQLGLSETPGVTMALAGGPVFVDPRLAALGARALLSAPPASFAAAPREDYERLRLTFGVPDGSRDLEVEKAILLENGFDELGAIDWDKGCWMGQELTARTRYRALIKKRLLPARFEGPAPGPGTAVMQDGREVGEVRSSAGERALVLLRLEAFDGPPLHADGRTLVAERPTWLRLPEAAPRPGR